LSLLSSPPLPPLLLAALRASSSLTMSNSS
jgi:hypothetical protein